MKFIAVILGAAVYLLLLATEGQCNDEEQTIVHQQMLEDLADLVRFQKQQQSDEPRRKYPTPGPKQIMLPCSYYRYGCCQDGKTRAKGPNRQGCGEEICADNAVGYCIKNKHRLDCRKGSIDYERCTYTCGCPKAAAASLLQKCKRSRTLFGCCWNGQPALTPSKRDCPPCQDLTPHMCGQFKVISNGCRSGSFGIRSFMESHCPTTCGVCNLKK